MIVSRAWLVSSPAFLFETAAFSMIAVISTTRRLLCAQFKRDGAVSVGPREPWFAVHYKLRAKDLLISLMRVSSRL
jgi:hypothetical protein